MFGNGKGLFGSGAQFAPQEKRGGGLFSNPSRLLGIFGDVAAGLAGQQGTYGPMMAQQRQQQAAEQRAQQQAMQAREWANQDWTARQEYERAHSAPRAPDAVDRLLAAMGWTDPSQPGYNNAAAIARRFQLGQPVTDAEGRAAVALPDIPTAADYARDQQPPPPPALGNVVDYRQAADVLLEGGTPAFNQMTDSGAIVRINNDQEFNNLPSGSRFIGPDGQLRSKP